MKVPVDAVTASFSGLDPDISVANARLQAPRVARVRHMSVDSVLALVSKYTDGRGLGFMGEPGVNVLELNLALDGRPCSADERRRRARGSARSGCPCPAR